MPSKEFQKSLPPRAIARAFRRPCVCPDAFPCFSSSSFPVRSVGRRRGGRTPNRWTTTSQAVWTMFERNPKIWRPDSSPRERPSGIRPGARHRGVEPWPHGRSLITLFAHAPRDRERSRRITRFRRGSTARETEIISGVAGIPQKTYCNIHGRDAGAKTTIIKDPVGEPKSANSFDVISLKNIQ